MSQEKFEGNIITGEALIVWCDSLWTPKKYQNRDDSKPRHEATFLFKPGQGGEDVIALAQECAKHYFPGDDWAELKTNGFQLGDKMADKAAAKGKKGRDFLRGFIVIQASSTPQYPPEVIDINEKAVPEGGIKGGEVVRASLNIVPYSFNGDGIKAYMNSVLLVTPLGQTHPVYGDLKKIGGRSAKEAFAEYTGKKREQDPSAGVDLSAL